MRMVACFQAFKTPPVSEQEYTDRRFLDGAQDNTVIGKIKESLNFMRNQLFEVPFIAFYRKEYVDPELLITDLWQVFQWDEKVNMWFPVRFNNRIVNPNKSCFEFGIAGVWFTFVMKNIQVTCVGQS